MIFQLIRRYFIRKGPEYTQQVRSRIAMAYAFLAWNSVIVFVYLNFKKSDSTENGENGVLLPLKEKTKHEKIQTITMDGFTVVRNEVIEQKARKATTDNTDTETVDAK